MATMRGNSGGYGMGAPSYGGGMNEPAQDGGSAFDTIRQQTSKIEDLLDSVAEPIKPYVNRKQGRSTKPILGQKRNLADGGTVTCP